jgi:hypothetical protein
MDWATLWAIFSQSLPVTLFLIERQCLPSLTVFFCVKVENKIGEKMNFFFSAFF